MCPKCGSKSYKCTGMNAKYCSNCGYTKDIPRC